AQAREAALAVEAAKLALEQAKARQDQVERQRSAVSDHARQVQMERASSAAAGRLKADIADVEGQLRRAEDRGQREKPGKPAAGMSADQKLDAILGRLEALERRLSEVERAVTKPEAGKHE